MVLLVEAEVRRIRTMQKEVHFDWRAALLARCNGPDQRHRVKVLDLNTGPVRGEFHVYARRGSADGDFSTGLVLFTLGGDRIPIVRLNGPHPNPHLNRFPRRLRLPVTPHVHYLTERYQQERAMRRKVDADGYALCTTAYSDLAGALAALARRGNLVDYPPKLPLQFVKGLP